MYCKLCKQFFQPSVDEEKLIIGGALEEICTPCATKRWAESVRDQPLPPPRFPGLEPEGDGTQLRRVVWYDANMQVRTFVSYPPKPPRVNPSPLRPKKADQLTVMVLSMHGVSSSSRLPTEPALTLMTNIDVFKLGETPKLWVQKMPAFYDDLTGVGGIEIAGKDIAEMRREEKRIVVKLVNGETVHFIYH